MRAAPSFSGVVGASCINGDEGSSISYCQPLGDNPQKQTAARVDLGGCILERFRSLSYQDSDAAVWYSVTRVSKKFFSFPRSIVSLIHGNGFFEPYCVLRPMRSSRRSAMYCT